MQNLEVMREKVNKTVAEARELIETAKTEERSLTPEERERQEKMMDEIRNLQADIQTEEELQRVESQKADLNIDPERDRYNWNSLGEFVRTVIQNPNDSRLNYRADSQAMDEGSEGGYLVPAQFSSELLTVQPDEAVIRPRANVFSGGDADFKIPAIQYHGENMFGGAEVTWIDEGGTKPQTDITFRQITLQPHEVAAHIEVTDKLLRNSNMIENVVRNILRGALIDAEEKEFLTGNGTSGPTGIVDHNATITVDHSTSLSYDELAEMLAKFRGRRGVWIVGRDMLPDLMEIEDGANHYIWQPNARDGNPGTLFGYPVVFSDHSPNKDSKGSIVLADLSYYLIKDGVGVSIAASQHVKFTNNITVIKAFKTVDGTPWLDNALPTKGGDYTTSPFVELGEL